MKIQNVMECVQYAFIGSDVDGTHINVESLVKPNMKIPPETTRIHGISDKDVKSEVFKACANEFCLLANSKLLILLLLPNPSVFE